MKIYNNQGVVTHDLTLDNTSYRYRAIMGENALTLHFSSESYVNIPVGSYCEFQGEKYTLTSPKNFEKKGNRKFEYTLIMYSVQYSLDNYKFKDKVSQRLKFSLTAKPKEHLQLLVDNMNMRETGWTVGDCIEGDEQTIGYNHISCLGALKEMADTFKTEWEVKGKTISLKKVEYNKESPLPLEYGKGLVPGVGRTTVDSSKAVTILYVQGGTKNIDRSKYGSTELLLPKSQALTFEGRKYKTDANGLYITRADKELTSIVEESLDASNIYPKRVSLVTSVVVPNKDKNFYDFIDDTIPEELNYEDCLIAGETMTIIFQSGMLSGKEFEVKYIHSERKFQIVPQEIDGVMMPDEVYTPNVNDKYAVFGISLPDAYVCNNSDQSGASWDMFRAGAKALYECEDIKCTYKGELDGVWSKWRWLEIGGMITLGGYILFTDRQFEIEGVKIRIVGIKDFIHKPYSPTIELSNEVVGGSVKDQLIKIDENEVITDDLFNGAVNFTKRRWRDAKETLEMLAGALLNFSGAINPITVHTMMMLLGDESLQYRFVDSKTAPHQVGHVITYDNDARRLHVPAGIIQHMTIGIKDISSSHKISDYKFWDMAEFNSPPLVNDKDAYYLYAKVSKTSQSGTFRLNKKAIKIEEEPGYYHLLVGVLNSEFDKERSFVELYGFTEILPGRVTTDRVVSADGQNFLDFVNNAFRVGNENVYIDFNSKGDGKLRLKGTIAQSESGAEFPIGVFRGAFNYSYTYYKGDEVTYNDGVSTSTYKYIYDTPRSGVYPTNATYWQVVAKGQQGIQGIPGDDGIDGGYFEYRYAKNGSTTSWPSLSYSSANPSGWTTTVPSVYSLEYLWFTVARKDCYGNLETQWSTPKRMTPYDGIDGKPGDVGPCMAFQGSYSSTKKYYGTSKRVDAVKYNGSYYVARVDAGNGFTNKVPTDTDYWNGFGAEFESVATNLLLAEKASIGSWWHSGGKIVSTLEGGNKITLDASAAQIIIESTMSGGDYSQSKYQGSIIKLDAVSGLVEARSKSNNSRVAYMSPSGIFCNNAETQAVSATFGSDVRAAIVGLGYGNVSKSDWDNGNFLAGVYGTASNSGNAPAYGGFFQNLMAAGLLLNRRAIESSGVYLSSYDSLVIGYSSSECTVYLPNDAIIGRVIFFKQWWTGSMKVFARGGQTIYDDSSANSYFRVSEGKLAIAIFTIGYVGGVKKEAWLINTIQDLINN